VAHNQQGLGRDSTANMAAAARFCMPAGTPSFFDAPGPVALLRLAAGGRVPPHVGTTNLRIKCHLALQLPPPLRPLSTPAAINRSTEATDRSTVGHQQPTVTVAGVTRKWEAAGQIMAFDDSYVHSVSNLAPERADGEAHGRCGGRCVLFGGRPD
jgi:hypothetical protein